MKFLWFSRVEIKNEGLTLTTFESEANATDFLAYLTTCVDKTLPIGGAEQNSQSGIDRAIQELLNLVANAKGMPWLEPMLSVILLPKSPLSAT